jgi:NADPH:quinone reductase-like Zn-dependent oxidoreductase
LILGAGGGVGSHTVQLMRARGASFIAGCSQTPGRLLEPPLNYDRAIDYTKEDVFSIQEFQENPFDVFLDLSCGNWLKLVEHAKKGDKSIVKPASQGGRYYTTNPDVPYFGESVSNLMSLFLCIPLWRVVKSRAWSRRNLPKFTFAMSLPKERSVMTKTMNFAEKGTLKAVIDPKGPFPFTTEGVRKAFRLQESRHIQGKVVVKVSQ